MRAAFGYTGAMSLQSGFNAFALRTFSEDEMVRLKTEKRLKNAFLQANLVDTATFSRKQIKEQLKSIATTPIDVLKKFLPDSNENSFRVTISDFCSVMFKRFKNFVLGLSHNY